MTDVRRRIGADVCSTLILDMLFVLKVLVSQILQALRDPDLINIRDNAAEPVTATERDVVVRMLEGMALMKVVQNLRAPAAPLVREIIFEVQEE